MITRTDIILDISTDLSTNPNNYSEDALLRLKDLLQKITKYSELSAEVCKLEYDNIVNNNYLDRPITDYWNSNYINKNIYKSLKKFYYKEISNYDLLLMILSVMNRSVVASQSTNTELFLFRVFELSSIFSNLVSLDISQEYPNELTDRLYEICKDLGLFREFIK